MSAATADAAATDLAGWRGQATPVRLDRRSLLWTAAAVAAALLPLALVLPAWLVAVLAVLWAAAVALLRRGILLPMVVRLPLTLLVAGAALAAYDFRFGRDTGAALLATMLVFFRAAVRER